MCRNLRLSLTPFVALSGLSLPAFTQSSILIEAQEAKLRSPDAGASDLYGNSVDMDGSFAVVGAIYDDDANGGNAGAVYVYERTGNSWNFVQKLLASDGSSSDYFGGTVAIDGDTIVVGAYADDAPSFDSGSAYVFVRCNGVWTERAKLIHPSGATSDYFGHQVAVDGNTVVVGSYQDDTCATNAGSVWVYVRNTQGNNDPCDDTWTLQTASGLTPSNCQAEAAFGVRLDIQANRLIVGAHLENSPNSDQGAAYIFDRTSGVWSETTTLFAGDGAVNDYFGADVAIDGDTAFVGAYRDDAPEVDRGSVYVFTRQGGSWFFQQKLVASDGGSNRSFGLAIVVQGSTALIGTYQDDLGSNTDSGSAYLFRKSGGTWVQDHKITLADGATSDEFGLAVALDGGYALISARNDDDQASDAGTVAAYTISQGQFETYGFGDGTGPTPCPCNNHSATSRDQGCINSRGSGGKLFVSGSDSASADNFRMVAWNLVPGNPALLFSGPNRINGGDGVVFGNGLRLVGGFIVRRGIQSPNSDGRAIWGPGLSGASSWPVGTAVHFQAWYRDPFHSCVDVYNLTNGVTILFTP